MSIRMAVNMLFYICKIKISGPDSILIRGNGVVIPHCTLSGFELGNVMNKSLKNIWREHCLSLPMDSRLNTFLNDFRVVRTERLQQLRCLRK